MKKKKIYLLIIIVVLVLSAIISYKSYWIYMKSLHIDIKERIIVTFSGIEGKYVINLNESKGKNFYVNLKNDLFNGDYIDSKQFVHEEYIGKKYYSTDSKNFLYEGYIYVSGNKTRKYNLSYKFRYWTTDSKYIIGNSFNFSPKCQDCDYLIVYSIDSTREKNIWIYDEKGNKIFIESVLGYVLDN